MAWTLHAIVIHPDDRNDVGEVAAHYSLQDVLDATATTIAWYGSSSERRQIDFILDENENGGTGLSTLKTDVATNADVTLVNDQGSQGTYRLENLRYVRRQALNKTLPVWSCTARLVKS